MNQDFTIQEVKDFMFDICKFKWYGEIYDEELGQYRMAKIEDFNELKINGLLVVKARNGEEINYYDSTRIQEVGIIIFGDTFKILMGKDYSCEWQNFKMQAKNQTI